MAPEGAAANPDVISFTMDPAKASSRFYPLPSTLSDFITPAAYEGTSHHRHECGVLRVRRVVVHSVVADLLFYLDRTHNECNDNLRLGWLDAYQQHITSGLVGSALPIIYVANRYVPNIVASIFVSSACIWLALALFVYAAAVFYPLREREARRLHHSAL